MSKQKSYFLNEMEQPPRKEKFPAVRWIKRLGIAGFLFFLVKGLIWLTLAIGATYFSYKLTD